MNQDPKPSSSSQQSHQEIFRQKSFTIFKMITPDNIAAIAHGVHAEGLIPAVALQNCMISTRSIDERAHSLLGALRVTIDVQPDQLTNLIRVLKDNETFQFVAEQMENDM